MRQFSNQFHSRLGQALKKAREDLEISRQKVCDQTGIPVTMITQYERQGVLPSDYRFDALMRLYGLNGDEFLRSVEIPSWDDVMGIPEFVERD